MNTTDEESLNVPDPDEKPRSRSDVNINDLPEELLVPILKFLPPSELDKVARVCKTWQTLVDETIGRQIFVGSDPEFIPSFILNELENPHFQALEKLSQVGVKTCFIGYVQDPYNSYGVIEYLYNSLREWIVGHREFPSFKSPDLVENIHFCDRIHPPIFQALISPLKNLKEFSIHLSTLNSITSELLSPIKFPHLDKLVVWGGIQIFQDQWRFKEEWNINRIMENTIILLQKPFPSLKTLMIEFPYDSAWDKEIITSILEVIHRTKHKIQTLGIEFNLLVDQDVTNRDLLTEDTEIINLSLRALADLQLKNLELAPYCLYQLPHADIWERFVQKQNKLRYLIAMGVFYTQEFLQHIITENFSTLSHLCVSRISLYDNEVFRQIDCAIFEQCDNLTHLVLRGWTLTLSVRGMIHVECLPKSLKDIDIGEMALTSEDVKYIALSMPNLQHLELRYVGNREEMGMTMDVFEEILRARRLKSVMLQRSFNGSYPKDGVFNGDEEMPLMIKDSKVGFITIELGERGYYEERGLNANLRPL